MALNSLKDFCKDNKIIIIDCSNQFIEKNDEKFSAFIDKTNVEKYCKTMLYIDLGIIYYHYAQISYLLYGGKKDKTKYKANALVFYDNRVFTFHKANTIAPMILRKMIKSVEVSTDCIICLQDTETKLECPHCTAHYCSDCIFDSPYDHLDDDKNILCCSCNGIICKYVPGRV